MDILLIYSQHIGCIHRPCIPGGPHQPREVDEAAVRGEAAREVRQGRLLQPREQADHPGLHRAVQDRAEDGGGGAVPFCAGVGLSSLWF